MEDFERPIRQLISEWKPSIDYRKLDDRQLLHQLAMLRAMGRDTVARIIIVGWPDADLKDICQDAADITDNPNPRVRARLYELCQSTKPAEFLVWCRLEQEGISREITERLKQSRVGMEILRFKGRKAKPETLDDLHNALKKDLMARPQRSKVDTMISFKPGKESDEDITSIAVENLWKHFKEMGQTLKVEFPKGSYPLTPFAKVLPVAEEPWGRWERKNIQMLEEDFAQMQETILPALQGKKLTEQTHQGLRNYFEKWEAQKRVGEEVSLEEVKELAGEQPSSRISSLVAKRAYKKIIDRHGEKARIYLDALGETGWTNKINIKEASEVAEISRVTAHKWLREYELEIKKPTKPRKK